MHKLLLGYMAFALIILAGCGPNETDLAVLDGFIYEMQAKCIKNCGTGFSVTMEYVARCPQLVDAYQGVMNSRPAGFATNEAQLQAIYNIFSQEVSKFDEMTSGWANDCGQLLASGIETKDVPPSQSGLLSNSLREIVHTLNQLQSELAD